MNSEVEDLQQTMTAARRETRRELRAVEEQLYSLHRDVSRAIQGVPPPQPLRKHRLSEFRIVLSFTMSCMTDLCR